MRPLLAIFSVAALVVLAFIGRRLVGAWIRYRGTRLVVCPENQALVAVSVDAAHAARRAAQGRAELRLESCTRWPEKRSCGQECLAQVEAAPEACLLRTILSDWYQGRSCASCGKPFHARHWHDHEPGLRAPDGTIRGWDGFRPEEVVDVLATHAPLCWSCRVAEGFRKEHPELVTDRPVHSSPPPSMR
jgi:hypothetical protein